MGKGGNATIAFVGSNGTNNNNDATETTLELERKEKINNSPEFYWASGESMEEPHVKRCVRSFIRSFVHSFVHS